MDVDGFWIILGDKVSEIFIQFQKIFDVEHRYFIQKKLLNLFARKKSGKNVGEIDPCCLL